MSESTADAQDPKLVTPGIEHWRVLQWLDRTGLPSWQIALAFFLGLTVSAQVSLVISGVPNPGLYASAVAFVAIVSYFLFLYLELARGWYQDLLEILQFDPQLIDVRAVLEPSRMILSLEVVLAFCFGMINFQINDVLPKEFSLLSFMSFSFYWLQYLFVIFCVDIFFRQLMCLTQVCTRIRISLLEADFYAVLANSMLRFLKLYVYGLCIVFGSYTVFTSGELGYGSLVVLMTPFYLPGLFMLGVFMLPYRRFKHRIHIAKVLELNHVQRALAKGDKAHLNASLIGADAELLHVVDLMYYEERVERIKELPFTNRIRSMLLFGVLPPLTWVIAALIEIFIEGVL